MIIKTYFILVNIFVRPPIWSSGQSFWLQIQRSGFDSRLSQIFWEVVGLERGPLSLGSTIEELLERKSSGSGLENRDYGRRNPLRWPHGTLYPRNLALTSSTCGDRSFDISLVFFPTSSWSCSTWNGKQFWQIRNFSEYLSSYKDCAVS
jgi:hypothetical protein